MSRINSSTCRNILTAKSPPQRDGKPSSRLPPPMEPFRPGFRPPLQRGGLPPLQRGGPPPPFPRPAAGLPPVRVTGGRDESASDRSRSPSPAPSQQSDASGTDDASYAASVDSTNWRQRKPRKMRAVKFNTLKPEINRIPIEKWSQWQKKEMKQSVLDVATEQRDKEVDGFEGTRPVRLGINSKYLQQEISQITNQVCSHFGFRRQTFMIMRRILRFDSH